MARGTAHRPGPETAEAHFPGGAGTSGADVHRVLIGSLRPADSPRLRGEDREHVVRLAGVETPLPPILVHRPTMRVIDGMHRLRAAMLRGDTEIEAVFFDGSAAEAFARAVELNVAHGLPLTLADRRAAAARILAAEPQASDRRIAARTGLSARTVASVRRSTPQIPQTNARVGTDGRARPVSGAGGRQLAAQIISARPEASLREVARAAGISLSTAHDVRKRLLQGRDPVPRGATTRSAAPPAPTARPDDPIRPGAAPRPAGAARTNADARSGPDAGPAQAREVLVRLMKDPALRHTDSGRELLRVLNAQTLTEDDWTGLVAAVPSHCREAVAGLARETATAWALFAAVLDSD
ncbi:ParB N-terminal domain-containing protein [Actinoallomurus sp. NPDC050550]|uniref:ParB/RepB/Spo0J family partition protein n=1 Tax=Actinoallomurus sp. NPDC050550 TaxID=3154937 RepID=UPI00340F6644